jgi:hypothetical protein
LREITQTNLSEVKNLTEQEKVVRPESVSLLCHVVNQHCSLFPQTERTEALAALASKNKEIAELQKEMAQYGACDPVQVEARKRGIVLAHEAAVRWTGASKFSLQTSRACYAEITFFFADNFSMLRSNFLTRTGADWAPLQAYLGIRDTDEFEDIS